MENLKLHNLQPGTGQALTRDELKNLKGGNMKPPVYSCIALKSNGQFEYYQTDDAELMQAWYAFWAAAGDNPTCLTFES
ncbi:MAG: hypothetical protein JWR09_2341 [Mucilaginibacter sp.]|nr:hypothetical protein [Mucilaginibacter sp.]